MAAQGIQVEIFEYPEMPWSRERDGLPEPELRARLAEMFPVGSEAGPMGRGDSFGVAKPASAALDTKDAEAWAQQMAAECRIAEERGRREGVEAGQAQAAPQAREEAARQLQGERARLQEQGRGLVESFAEARDGYLHQLEQESVRLALAIAARILRREAQMDPLLLTGAVRVALGQLAESTTVRLRVPKHDEAMWREAMTAMPGLAIRPQVVGIPEMELGECRVETELGTADLGLWAQLKEIERGFFDRVGEAAVAPVASETFQGANLAGAPR